MPATPLLTTIYPGYLIDFDTENEPFTVAQVKTRLGITVSDYDTQLAATITAARQYIERYTKRRFFQRVITQYWDGWPKDRCLKLAFSPVDPDTFSIKYLDEADAEQFLVGFQLDAVSSPHRVYFPSSLSLPDIGEGLNRVYAIGNYGTPYDPDSNFGVPAPLIEEMYNLIAFWFNNPGAQDIDDLNRIHTVLNLYVTSK